MRKYLSIIMLPVILVLSIFTAALITSNDIRNSNRQWCSLINLLTQGPPPPKSNIHSYSFYVAITERKQTLGC